MGQPALAAIRSTVLIGPVHRLAVNLPCPESDYT